MKTIKRTYLMVIATMMATMSIQAQDNPTPVYFELNEMPSLLEIMPPPPSFDSPEFANDVVRYGWGKQQRQDPERLELAMAGAEWDNLTKL